MARVLNTAVANVIGNPARPPEWLTELFRYWYHLAIVLVGLFILTTVDTGTRVGRSLLQETMGRMTPKLGEAKWWPAVLAATVVVTGAWWYLLDSGDFWAQWSAIRLGGAGAEWEAEVRGGDGGADGLFDRDGGFGRGAEAD